MVEVAEIFVETMRGPQRSARYGWLVEALLRAIEERRELPDGSVE
jgi:hypothetical protein